MSKLETHWTWVKVVSGPLTGYSGQILGKIDHLGEFEVLSCQGEYDMVDFFKPEELEVIEENPGDHTVFILGEQFLRRVG